MADATPACTPPFPARPRARPCRPGPREEAAPRVLAERGPHLPRKSIRLRYFFSRRSRRHDPGKRAGEARELGRMMNFVAGDDPGW